MFFAFVNDYCVTSSNTCLIIFSAVGKFSLKIFSNGFMPAKVGEASKRRIYFKKESINKEKIPQKLTTRFCCRLAVIIIKFVKLVLRHWLLHLKFSRCKDRPCLKFIDKFLKRKTLKGVRM